MQKAWILQMLNNNSEYYSIFFHTIGYGYVSCVLETYFHRAFCSGAIQGYCSLFPCN